MIEFMLNSVRAVAEALGAKPNEVIPVISAAFTVLGTIFGAVMGAAIALIVTFLQNRHAYRRHKEDLEERDHARSIERAMAMRKEVFLEAAGSFADRMVYLGSIINLDTPNAEVAAKAQTIHGPITKCWLVSNVETIRALQTYDTLFNGVMANLMMKRAALLPTISELSFLQKQLNDLDESILLSSRDPTREGLDMVSMHQRKQALEETIHPLSKEAGKLKMDLAQNFANAVPALIKAQGSVVMNARAEIGLAIAPDVLQDIQQDAQEQNMAIINSMIESGRNGEG